jgi:hypothetical protein
MNAIVSVRISPRLLLSTALGGTLLAAALVVGCASHRDDYGGSNDIGFSPMYGAYDSAYDGSWAWSPGYYPTGVVIDVGPVF